MRISRLDIPRTTISEKTQIGYSLGQAEPEEVHSLVGPEYLRFALASRCACHNLRDETAAIALRGVRENQRSAVASQIDQTRHRVSSKRCA